MFRKRYRPLDAVEERSVGVEQTLHVGLLRDEQSYCFRWPDAPLTALLRQSDLSLVLGMQSNPASGMQAHVILPASPNLTAVLAEHGKGDLASTLSADNPAISFSSGLPAASNSSVDRVKRPHVAPASASADDNIFSFNAFQLRELESSGAFEAFYEARGFEMAACTGDRGSSELKAMARRKMEGEVVLLEWRVFQETQKISATIQRILLLTVAVPFLENSNYANSSIAQAETKWRRILYDLWVKWRIGGLTANKVACGSEVTPWGATLLPGSFAPSLSRDYFMSAVPDRVNALKGTKTNDTFGGDSEGCQVISSVATGRRGAYGYLRWRIDLYEPRLRAAPKDGHDGYGLRSPTKLMGVAEVNKLVEEKLPPVLGDVRLVGRVDPLDALALMDIRSGVEAWRQWLAHV